jgi:hypothetical protein
VECPDGQRQGPTAAAGRDEGVTSPSPVISAQGRLRAGPYLLATTVGRDVRDTLAVGPPRAAAALEFLDGPGLREAALRQTQRSCRSIARSTSASYPQRLAAIRQQSRHFLDELVLSISRQAATAKAGPAWRHPALPLVTLPDLGRTSQITWLGIGQVATGLS